MRPPGRIAVLAGALGLLAACSGGSTSGSGGSGSGGGLPRPAHVVVVVLENQAADAVLGNPSAPYLNQLARTGAQFTDSTAITHPSQPNYLDLFAGSDQGVTDDSCPHSFGSDNLATELAAKGLGFTGYAENLPADRSSCAAGEYARKHVPWLDFSNVPAGDSAPFTAFPTDFNRLPTVSWVIPNLCDDAHDCPLSTADGWLRTHLDPYVQWARQHDSLLITTFDENDGSPGNRIATFFDGGPVRIGSYGEPIDHFTVLRTVEDMYGLGHAGAAADAAPVRDVWN
ncbi:alkaline phosphatase family protein [Kitasatospora viridis]|uniref:Acid phosphatase n=1 Tax=Kitasatospora viridis TaxID=281105 RepID=A0A561UBD0_9ACTN|nr:alkaline phosphatase family protein [Kitasatospora viridis]TWF96683.1 acid phosphatase [Kitasatospora viridis]